MAVTLSHFVALGIALAMPLAPWLRIGLAVSITASMAYAIRHHILRNGHYSVTGLKSTRDGLSIEMRHDGWMLCDILDSSVVTPWLTVLHLKLAQRPPPIYVVVLPDMLGADEFRRLRVWLKWAHPHTHGKDRDAVL